MSLLPKSLKGIFRHDQWNIGLTRGNPADFLTKPENFPVQWLPWLNNSLFYADPFGLEKNGLVYLFFETFPYNQWKGRIDCSVFDGQHFEKPFPVLTSEFHLSYPFVFQVDGDFFCIPEMGQSNSVALFRATRFPFEWKKEATLLNNFAGVDNSLLRFENKWWLFSTNYHHNPNSDLHLFFSDRLTGPYFPHPKNPVKSDWQNSRPGGSFFLENNQLLRIAMDNSKGYGSGITLNRIDSLSPEEFSETTLLSGKPFDKNYPMGWHTLSRVAGTDYLLLDGLRQPFIPASFRGKLMRKFRP